jgi:REP element-mobilizing transposase RayT
MPQSLAQIYLHIVYSTKDRCPFLTDPVLRGQLHGYLVGTCQNLDCPPLQIGGVEDHVHVLCRLGRSISVADLVCALKLEASKWIKERSVDLADFHWQAGYGAFSISPAHVDGLKHYIVNQEEHHRQESYSDEFRRLCRLYGLEIDERYVWD